MSGFYDIELAKHSIRLIRAHRRTNVADALDHAAEMKGKQVVLTSVGGIALALGDDEGAIDITHTIGGGDGKV